VNGDGVCDDNDCGLVVNDVREGSDTNERDEKSVDDECSDSELDFVGIKCVDNASSCLAEQSDVDDGNDAVFDSESRDGDGTVPGSQLATVGMFASCVEDDNDGVNDNGFVDTSSGGVSIDGVIVVCNNDVFVNDNDCSDSWSHDFDCGCADNDDDDENVPPSTPTLDVGNDDSEYNDVTSATPTF
jgi:hypothetical protein